MSFRYPSSRLVQACALILFVGLSACGGSGSSGTPPITDCTQPSITDAKGCTYVNLTDSPDDFLTYTVNVTALTLTRSDGTVVSLVPNPTTVDFAQYDDLSEFFTLAAMPVGVYTGGSITLDYTNADIEVTDANGNAAQVKPVDASGKPVTTITLNIDLDNQASLVLAPGVPQVYQLDFDLDASNVVNINNSTVIVQPFLVASVNPDLDNQAQVRGPLTITDTADGNFTLDLQPFYATKNGYGSLKVFTKDDTVYNINRIAYSGSAGLAALAAAGATTAVLARGTFDFDIDEFVATEVDAGSSLPGGTLDAAEGVILNRSGNTLVLRGTTLYRAGQTAVFRDKVTVTLGSGTKVHEAGSAKNSLDISAISVGQRLLVFGTLTDTDPSSLALDATSGFARLKLTKFDGQVTTAPGTSGGNASMGAGIQFIEGRSIAMFNFAGTGTSGATDADPAKYVISLPGVLDGIAFGDPVRVWGFVAPFGGAPPDFTATSVADYVDANTRLAVAWPSPGTSNAFLAMATTNGIMLSLASSPPPLFFNLKQGVIVTPIPSATLLSSPTVEASLGIFAIAQDGTVQLHVTFADFLSDLNARLSAGGKLRGFFARGGFVSSTETMQANEIAVIIQ